MKNHVSPKIHQFTNAFADAQPSPDGQTASPEEARPSGSKSTTAPGGATRGRPSTYHPRIIEMLCQAIRQLGLSDSAAAERMGLSTTTLSRWKQVHPEVGLQLQQARQEIRALHLQKIMESASAENGKGWRASAWILERLFPEDYARKISDRFEALNLIEFRKDKERRQVQDEDEKEKERKDALRAEAAGARAAAASAAAALSLYSESDSHYSRNAEEVAYGEEVPDRAGGGANQSKESGRPRPIAPDGEAASLGEPHDTSADEHASQRVAARLEYSGRGRPDSLKEATQGGSIECLL